MNGSLKRLAFGIAIAFVLSGPMTTAVGAQSAVQDIIQEATPGQESRADSQADVDQKPAVSRLLPDQWIPPSMAPEAAPIYLDGRTLFRVSAPFATGDTGRRGLAEDRAQQIQQRLNSIIRNLDSPPQVTVSVDEPSNLPVIVVGDQMLLTVTNLDAQLGGYASPNLLALTLAGDLREAFERYFQERSPEFLQQQAKVTVGIILTVVLLQLGAMRLALRLKRRQTRLMNAKTRLGSERSPRPIVSVPATLALNSVYEQFKARLDNHQKLKLNEMEQSLLLVFQVVIWGGGLLGILYLFPYSRWLTVLLLQWLKIPAQILLLSGVAYLAVRVSSLIIDKVSLAVQEGAQWAPEKSQRLSLRFSTFSQVAKGVVGAVILAATILVSLAIAGIQIAPLLAGAGIAGIGISLAAQSLIKDIINGFLILLEDHFGIGDVVSIDGLTGAVEHVNLRITQLRDTEGRLITIPNSQISVVQNLSMDWAQVDLSVTVAHQNDLGEVLSVLKTITTDLSQEADWQRLILEPPDILGVEALDYKGITLRIFLKTQPLQQWPVARELRRRIKTVFDQKGIAIGIPQEQITVYREYEIEALAEAETQSFP